jgi:hypothetical protein
VVHSRCGLKVKSLQLLFQVRWNIQEEACWHVLTESSPLKNWDITLSRLKMGHRSIRISILRQEFCTSNCLHTELSLLRCMLIIQGIDAIFKCPTQTPMYPIVIMHLNILFIIIHTAGIGPETGGRSGPSFPPVSTTHVPIRSSNIKINIKPLCHTLKYITPHFASPLIDLCRNGPGKEWIRWMPCVSR